MAADESEENVVIIDEAAKIENRSRANFMRTACLERARQIIKENKENSK